VIRWTLFFYVMWEMLKTLLVALAWLMLVGLLVIFLRTRFTDAGKFLGARECLAGLIVVVPYLFSFMLPAAVLATVISTFGRLSSDNELVAMRASGISPLGTSAAPLAAGLLASLMLLWLNVEGFRYAGAALTDVESDFKFSEERLTRAGTGFEVNHGDGKMVFSFLRPLEEGSGPVRVTRIEPGGESFQLVARRFDCEIEQRLNRKGRMRRFIDFHLYDVQVVQDPFNPYGEGRFGELHFTDLEMPGAITRALIGGGSEMRSSLPQNLARIRELRGRMRKLAADQDLGLRSARARLVAGGAGGGGAGRGAASADLLSRYLRGFTSINKEKSALVGEASRKVAFSFSPLLFALVGMGLGAVTRKSSKLIGLSLGVLVAALYYGAWVASKGLVQQALLSPMLAPWIPNLLALAGGLWLMRRQNRARA